MKKILTIRIIVLALAAILLTTISCAPKLEYIPNPETDIPEDFITYYNEQVFSISYPREWIWNPQMITQSENLVKKFFADKVDKQKLDQAKIIFLAGFPVETGLLPNTVVVIEPLPKNINSIDALVESQIKGIKQSVKDYNEQYRIKTTIDNRDAGIVEYRGDFNQNGMISHNLLMVTIVDDTVWTVTCTTIEGIVEFNDHEADLLSVVRSFRSLQ